MALTPYKSQENSLNRSRSSSCSSPIRNRIIYQEIYSVGTNTLVRSYSCDQVFDKDEAGLPFQATQIQFSSFITPEKGFGVKSFKKKIEEPRRLSTSLPPDKPEMAENHQQRKTKISERKNESMTALRKAVIFILLTMTNACGFYFYLQYRECSYVWDLEKTSDALKKNIFGQNQAVLKINSVLKACNSSSDVYIMLFTGGVGVGKTYSSSIISHNFPWSSNKLITYSEYFAADVSKLLKGRLSTCGCNLVIVDDLSVTATKEAISLISLLNSERKKNENILIILIFQSHTEKDRNEIIQDFKKAYVNFNHVPFKAITEKVVRKCIDTEIQRQGIEIPEEEVRKLVKDRMSHNDITKGPTGCKGVIEDVASYFKRPAMMGST